MRAKVVQAHPEDIPLLNEISIAAKMYWGYPAEWMENWKEELSIKEQDFYEQEIFKLQADEWIIGFCAIKENEAYYEITHLWIRPEFIAQGFGKILLNESISNVVKVKKPVLVEADPNAEPFYARQGFITIGKRESFPKGRFLPLMKKEFLI